MWGNVGSQSQGLDSRLNQQDVVRGSAAWQRASSNSDGVLGALCNVPIRNSGSKEYISADEIVSSKSFWGSSKCKLVTNITLTMLQFFSFWCWTLNCGKYPSTNNLKKIYGTVGRFAIRDLVGGAPVLTLASKVISDLWREILSAHSAQ